MSAIYRRICQKRGHNVAVVAVARKLAELCWHLLTKEQDYLYAVPKRTQDKRSGVRKLARRKIGIQSKRAEPWMKGRTVLYGLGQYNSKIRGDAVKHAARQAEQLYEAIVEDRTSGSSSSEGSQLIHGFDPTKPDAVKWEKVLTDAAERVLKKVVDRRQDDKIEGGSAEAE